MQIKLKGEVLNFKNKTPDSKKSYLYYRGFLALDRAESIVLDKLASDLYKKYIAGTHVLFQRKIKKDVFEYYVQEK